jgi:hypothetical protein
MSKTISFDDCFVVVFEPVDAIRLHKDLIHSASIMPLPKNLEHMRDLLNDYTGLDDKAH